MQQLLTPGVKNLIVINVIIFILQILSGKLMGSSMVPLDLFALNYSNIMQDYYIWTPFTYMFLHGGLWHLFFNMLALFFFGCEVERVWGTQNFLKFYLLSGLGAGIIIFAFDICKALLFNVAPGSFTVGASGAIFGVLLAYSLLFSEREVTMLLFFIIPVTLRAKYLIVAILGATILFSAFLAQNISHVGHIGGIISAATFFFFYRKRSPFSYPYEKLASWVTKPLRKTRGSRSTRSSSYAYRAPRDQEKSSRRPFTPPFRARNHQHRSLDETAMEDNEIEEKIDELLDVISKQGLKSLTGEEKAFLNRVSLLYRHKFPN